ncbi:MAG: O-antigen ligase family protein, partial [Solirubrobacteraceae bacterium]
TLPETETASSHLLSLGSNRYDFWRVAADEFRDHPLAGIGARGWDVAYLQQGRSEETPRRSHSLELDVASEEGIVGLGLLALALVPLGLVLIRRARRDIVAAGLLGAGAYFVVHSAADWIWTFPAVGVLFFLLAGTGASPDDPPALSTRAAYPLAGMAAVLGLLVFAPVWTSARITAQELDHPGGDPHADLTWARRLDPLSTEPLLAEAELARRPADAIPPLARAADGEPRSAAVRYLLGQALLQAGRRADARRELEAARELSPRDPVIAEALRKAGNSAGQG